MNRISDVIGGLGEWSKWVDGLLEGTWRGNIDDVIGGLGEEVLRQVKLNIGNVVSSNITCRVKPMSYWLKANIPFMLGVVSKKNTKLWPVLQFIIIVWPKTGKTQTSKASKKWVGRSFVI